MDGKLYSLFFFTTIIISLFCNGCTQQQEHEAIQAVEIAAQTALAL